MKLTVSCSQEQLDIIEDYLLGYGELGALPDERSWMLAQARKIHPACRIQSADLNLVEGQWDLDISLQSI